MEPRAVQPACVLSIAGSDSGGGAGIQADLKAFAHAGVHGTTAITAITAQNTVQVSAVHPVPPETIVAQVQAVASDIGVDAVKIGMLGDAATIRAVAHALDLVGDAPVVLDPVMVAESGAPLLEPDAVGALLDLLVPRVTVLTPNLPEAAALASRSGGTTGDRGQAEGGAPDAAAGDEAEALARLVHRLGPDAVVVTGGHGRSGVDVFFDGRRLERIAGQRHPDGAAHGSGCTHSSTLAARLALGDDPLEAARAARTAASDAVRDGLRGIGRGAGPVDVLGVARRAGAGT
jgi:hydroxymethylpyrimidine/phosphomethylpyrimidine kinase